MKLAIVASLIAGAAAFAPAANQASSSSALAAKAKAAKAGGFENELGVQPPLDFWDPLGYLDGADQAQFEKLRGLELKHGRTLIHILLLGCWLIWCGQQHMLSAAAETHLFCTSFVSPSHALNRSFCSCRCCHVGFLGICHHGIR